MPARIPEESLAAIEQAVAQHPGGASFGDVAAALPERLADRTLQYRLRYLVNKGRLITDGEGRRWTRYRVPAPAAEQRAAAEKPAAVSAAAEKTEEAGVPLSAGGQEMRAYLRQPLNPRKPVGYNREILDSYRPNETFYLSEEQRAHLAQVGKPNFDDQAAGTYAKQILNRLLIDLSWNSSRLEGNTYSLLDT